MKTSLEVFKGKEAKNNKFILETLYDNGPLSAWGLTKFVREKNRMSLHATFNKRLRILKKKGYIKKGGKEWVLQLKGVIAVLITKENPKPWNEKWTEIFENYVKPFKKTPKRYTVNEDGEEILDIKEFVVGMPVLLKDFELWVALADKARKLIEKGLVNFDVINNKALVTLIMTEILTEQGTL